jgi:hypothetical protein
MILLLRMQYNGGMFWTLWWIFGFHWSRDFLDQLNNNVGYSKKTLCNRVADIFILMVPKPRLFDSNVAIAYVISNLLYGIMFWIINFYHEWNEEVSFHSMLYMICRMIFYCNSYVTYNYLSIKLFPTFYEFICIKTVTKFQMDWERLGPLPISDTFIFELRPLLVFRTSLVLMFIYWRYKSIVGNLMRLQISLYIECKIILVLLF